MVDTTEIKPLPLQEALDTAEKINNALRAFKSFDRFLTTVFQAENRSTELFARVAHVA